MRLATLLALSLLTWLVSFNVQAGFWGCKSAKIVEGKTTSGCIKSNHIKRRYTIHIPKNLKAKVPLVIGLHGGGGNAKRFSNYALLDKQADKIISVYPQGINKHWNDGRSNINPDIDDVLFLNQLVAHLMDDLKLPIDNHKIAVIGMSNGGLMALRLACEQPDWLSGVGIVAASMTPELKANCLNNKALKALKIAFVFGDHDTSFLTDGRQVNPVKPTQQRGTHIGIKNSVKFWHEVNGCADKTNKQLLNADKLDKTSIVKSTYQQCQQAVVFYNVKNGGHRWPNRDSRNGAFLVKRLNIGLASQDMNTAKELLADLLASNR